MSRGQGVEKSTDPMIGVAIAHDGVGVLPIISDHLTELEKISKKLRNPLDNPRKVCYNKYVIKREKSPD